MSSLASYQGFSFPLNAYAHLQMLREGALANPVAYGPMALTGMPMAASIHPALTGMFALKPRQRVFIRSKPIPPS